MLTQNDNLNRLYFAAKKLLANWSRLEPQAKRKSQARQQMLAIEAKIGELDAQANSLKKKIRAMTK